MLIYDAFILQVCLTNIYFLVIDKNIDEIAVTKKIDEITPLICRRKFDFNNLWDPAPFTSLERFHWYETVDHSLYLIEFIQQFTRQHIHTSEVSILHVYL